MKDQFGIRENELNWFTSYMTDRQQVCCVKTIYPLGNP